eukprot:1018545-Pelagomonas_calceolata.AAC.1
MHFEVGTDNELRSADTVQDQQTRYKLPAKWRTQDTCKANQGMARQTDRRVDTQMCTKRASLENLPDGFRPCYLTNAQRNLWSTSPELPNSTCCTQSFKEKAHTHAPPSRMQNTQQRCQAKPASQPHLQFFAILLAHGTDERERAGVPTHMHLPGRDAQHCARPRPAPLLVP